jgi:hypothetical protein
MRHAEPAPEMQAAEAPPRVEEPRVQEPRVEERQAVEPRIDAQQLLSDSGLVMVETDRAKTRVQAPEVEESQPQIGRPRRERQRPSAQDEELVQIETKR